MSGSLAAPLRSAFFEAVFVVFGVVLALTANEWRENVRARETAAGALHDILTELEADRALLTESRTYHKERIQIISRKLGTGEKVTGADFPRGFIRPAWVTDTAWQVATSTGAINHMDYATVLDISRAYDELEHYKQQTDLVGGLIYAAIFDDGTQGVAGRPENLRTIIFTFVYRESEAITKLEETLRKYGEAAGVAGPDSSGSGSAAPKGGTAG